MRGTEVDLVYRSVQAEADSPGRLTAVKVINDYGDEVMKIFAVGSGVS